MLAIGNRVEGFVRYLGRTYQKNFDARQCRISVAAGYFDEVEVLVTNDGEIIARLTLPKTAMLAAIQDWIGGEARTISRELAESQGRLIAWTEGRCWPRSLRSLR